MRVKIKLGALRERNFRWYFLGMCLSLSGSWLQYIALGWLIFNISHSATLLGLNSLVGGIPLCILPLMVGGVIDEFDKRILLLITQTLFFIQTFLLAILTLSHLINYQMILVFSLMNAIIFSIDQPLRQALLPIIIADKEDLPSAIAWNAFMNNLSRTIAPVIAGFVIFKFGEGICFLFDSISFLIMIFAIFQMSWQEEKLTSSKKPFGQTWLQGLNSVKNSLIIKQSLLLTFIISSTLGTYTLVMPVITQSIYEGDSKRLGYFLTASGIGAIIASLSMTVQSRELNNLINKIMISSILATLALVFLVNNTFFLFGIISIALLSASIITVVVSLNTIIQIAVEDAERGLIMSFFTTAYLGAVPFSNFFTSWLSDQVGVRITMTGLAVIFSVSVIYFLTNIGTTSQRFARNAKEC